MANAQHGIPCNVSTEENDYAQNVWAYALVMINIAVNAFRHIISRNRSDIYSAY